MLWREFSLFHVFMFLSFMVSGLMINMVQLVLYLVIVKLLDNRSLFRSFNYYLIYAIYGQLLFIADWWSGSKVTYYCQDEVLDGLGQEHAVILMNHHYELDWLYGWMVGDRAGILGNCRVYVKKVIQYVPVIGWAWCFSDTLFLARDWSKDQAVLDERLEALLDYPDPVWILLFPEGTRFTKDKYLASKKFAESRNLPVFKHHLVPRTKGFSYTISHLDPAKITWVYDVTLGCDKATPPTLTNILMGRPTSAHMYIRRFKLEDIPKDDEGSAEWLSNLYVEKDQLLDSFHTTGKFDDAPLPTHAGASKPPRAYSLVLSLAVNSCVVLPLGWAVLSGGWVALAIAVGVVGLAMAGIKYFVGITQISHSSAYGDKKTE